MSWWKRKKCPLCKTVLKKKHKTGKLCMETAEGPLELEICMGCSTVLDHSSQILENEYGDDAFRKKPLDLGEYEEVHGENDT